jgi:hypothetical protein
VEDREEYLERFRIDNEKMLSDAANNLRESLGDDGTRMDRLLKDKQKMMSLVNGLSEEDFGRLKQVLDNPQIMARVLGSEKAKKNLLKILGEL